MTAFLIWILPPILFFFGVMFFRKNVLEPKLGRFWYLFTPLFFVPIVGLVLITIAIGFVVAILIEDDAEWNEESRFYKKWVAR